jgi:methyl-accepting chemotaxis protein
MQAIGKSQAVVEFKLDGTIITANENFLRALGYALAEIQGKHHSMLVEPAERDSADYRRFWTGLGNGEYQAAEYKRIGKGGKEIWLQATYNPILDRSGKPFKVVKFATDITGRRLQSADYVGQIEAIGKSQAVVEFKLDGTIITANKNFRRTMGYTLPEIQGKHHSMFVGRHTETARNIDSFGPPSIAANFKEQSIGASANPARKCGSRRLTIRYLV